MTSQDFAWRRHFWLFLDQFDCKVLFFTTLLGYPPARGLVVAIAALGIVFNHKEEISEKVVDLIFELNDVGHLIGQNIPTSYEISETMHSLWQRVISWIPVRDPLALDLDGDGIETLGQNDSLLFDHLGAGLVNGTGWVKGDDGFLVLDRNGNGTIDNGGELFGVDTVMSNGHTAKSGFQALADFDENADGEIDSSDAVYSTLRVWQDSDEDAVTDAGELKTLEELNIASISLNATAGVVDLGNGNQVSRVVKNKTLQSN